MKIFIGAWSLENDKLACTVTYHVSSSQASGSVLATPDAIKKNGFIYESDPTFGTGIWRKEPASCMWHQLDDILKHANDV